MEELLVKAGLTDAQAAVYLYLVEHGESAPPAIASALTLTRSNTYKVLDSLEERGLAHKRDVRKKFTYRPADPSALASLVAQERNRVLALEQHVNQAMQQLRASYRSHSGESSAEVEVGKDAIAAAYETQAQQAEPMYFIKSRADVPFMGFDAMHDARVLARKYQLQRYGITPDGPENPTTPEIDARSNLVRTWIPSEDYTAPVEWTVSGDELLIIAFEGEGRVVRISDAVIADAFQQAWKLLDTATRARPDYQPYAPNAARHI